MHSKTKITIWWGPWEYFTLQGSCKLLQKGYHGINCSLCTNISGLDQVKTWIHAGDDTFWPYEIRFQDTGKGARWPNILGENNELYFERTKKAKDKINFQTLYLLLSLYISRKCYMHIEVATFLQLIENLENSRLIR